MSTLADVDIMEKSQFFQESTAKSTSPPKLLHVLTIKCLLTELKTKTFLFLNFFINVHAPYYSTFISNYD